MPPTFDLRLVCDTYRVYDNASGLFAAGFYSAARSIIEVAHFSRLAALAKLAEKPETVVEALHMEIAGDSSPVATHGPNWTPRVYTKSS